MRRVSFCRKKGERPHYVENDCQILIYMVKYPKSYGKYIHMRVYKMLIGEITLINSNPEFFILMANLMTDIVVALGLVTVVFASRKMSEKLRGSVYWVLFTLILASFFRNYVIEFITQVFSNLGSILYYSYIILTKRLYAQLLAVIVFAALVACPIILKIAGNLFKTKPIKTAGLSSIKLSFRRASINTGMLSKPSFHFIS